jgi:hypothetical protein
LCFMEISQLMFNKTNHKLSDGVTITNTHIFVI